MNYVSVEKRNYLGIKRYLPTQNIVTGKPRG